MENQFFILLIFISSGISIGFLFDIFRIRRRLLKLPNLITYIEDIIFWLITGAILIFVFYVVNSGTVRLYHIIALILGAILYFISISKFIFKGITSIKNIKKIVKK